MTRKLKIAFSLAAGTALLAIAASVLAVAGLGLIESVLADGKPAIQLSVENAAPREVEESVQQSIARDYAAAWRSLEAALESDNESNLKEDFVGFALEKFRQRVKDQRNAGLKTRLTDHGHQVEAVFYSRDGSAIELRDTATLEIEILEGSSVIHSERARVQYFAVMTGAEDRWKVRVLEDAPER